MLALYLVDLHAVVDGVGQLVATHIVYSVVSMQYKAVVVHVRKTALYLRELLVHLYLLDVLIRVRVLKLLFVALQFQVAARCCHLGVYPVVAI